MGFGCGHHVRKGARQNARHVRTSERAAGTAAARAAHRLGVEVTNLNSPRLDPLHVDGSMVGPVSKCVHARPEFWASRQPRGILLRRLAPDAPGLWMEPAGLRKMLRCLIALALSQQILCQPEMRVRFGNCRIRQ